MKELTILGCPASNRSRLTVADAEVLARCINEELTPNDFAIHDSVSDGVSRSRELVEHIQRGLDCKELSNSELGTVAALVAARAQGVRVDLAPMRVLLDSREGEGLLRDKLARADGLLMASPVYFGDRSSVVQRFVDRLYADDDLAGLVRGKAFTGVSVGAKRNGGQETLLIYQMLDFLNFGVVGVGNDSRSTSQYGGTITAGDKGTALGDEYGILTSQGAGRRVASIASIRQLALSNHLTEKLRVGFFIVQDQGGRARSLVESLIADVTDLIEPVVFDISREIVKPCSGCRLCPANYGVDKEYTCFVQDKDDFFVRHHADIVHLDALVPVAFSPLRKQELITNYQVFVERTRYIRRSDYLYSNRMLMPLIFEEVGGSQNLHIRLITSFIRHETIVFRPLVGVLHGGALLDEEAVRAHLAWFVGEARELTAGRLAFAMKENATSQYNPIGYALKYSRDLAESAQDKRKANSRLRLLRLQEEFRRRVAPRQAAGIRAAEYGGADAVAGK